MSTGGVVGLSGVAREATGVLAGVEHVEDLEPLGKLGDLQVLAV